MGKGFQWGEFSENGLLSVANCNSRTNIWEGAVRSSKTICSLVAWINFVSVAPPGDLLIFGKTERTVKRNILSPLKDMLGKLFDYKIGSGEATMLGRKILIVGANDERAESKIRGGTLAGAYGDELTLIPESFIKMLLTRLSVEGARFFGTTNPDSPYHFVKTELIDNPNIDISVFHFELDDNHNLSESFKDALKREFIGLWYKRFILGLWVMAEGAIYDMWDDKIHLKEAPTDLEKYKKIWASIDYGTSNPCTFGLYGMLELEKEESEEDGEEDPESRYEIYKLAEYWFDSKERGFQKTDSDYGDDFDEFVSPYREYLGDVYVDPSALSFKTELENRGYGVLDAINDVVDGIRIVSTELGQKRYFVDPKCKNTAKEYVSYAWDPKAQKRGEDKPLKKNDHAMDCDRYALASELLIPDFYIR